MHPDRRRAGRAIRRSRQQQPKLDLNAIGVGLTALADAFYDAVSAFFDALCTAALDIARSVASHVCEDCLNGYHEACQSPDVCACSRMEHGIPRALTTVGR